VNALDLLRSVGGAFTHRLRAALTLLGIAIGTGSIVLLASLIGAGKSFLASANQEVSNKDVVEASPKDAPPSQKLRTTRPLSREDAQELAQAAQLAGTLVAEEHSHDTQAHFGEREKRVGLVSASDQTLSLYRLAIARGRALDEQDRQDGRRVCVIGHEVYEELLRSAPLDKGPVSIELEDHLFTVVGVLERKPMMGGSMSTYAWDRKVLVPATTYDVLFSPDHQVNRIYVRHPNTTEQRERARSTMTELLKRRHFGVENFQLTKDRSGDSEELIFAIIQVLLLGTGVLALLASGINIMNVMLVTVSERTREIGLRRAIGATPRSILVQFLLESGTLSLTGGAGGVLAGVVLAWLVALGARASLGHWEFVVPPWSVALGLLLALLIGLVFGILPAWRASKVTPIEALRAE
jgi:putative ABC transport system permease protein